MLVIGRAQLNRQADGDARAQQCLTVSGKKPVAFYDDTQKQLRVHPRGQDILDDLGELAQGLESSDVKS